MKKSNRNDSHKMLPESYTYIDLYTVQIQCVRNSQIFGKKKFSHYFDREAVLKYKYGNRMFWRRQYGVDTVEKNTKKYVNISIIY